MRLDWAKDKRTFRVSRPMLAAAPSPRRKAARQQNAGEQNSTNLHGDFDPKNEGVLRDGHRASCA
jgi:hypothetical protein